MIQALLGVVLAGFLITLVFGLVTGRIAWRQQGCCPADSDDDLRMRTSGTPSTTTGTTGTTRRRDQ